MAIFGLMILLSLGIATTHINAEGYVLTKEDTRIIEAKSGHAELITVVPTDFTKIRVNMTDYECTDTECKNINDGPGVPIIAINKEHLEDAVRVTAQLCNVQDYTWLGFDISHMMTEKRQAFHTIHFSQGGNWNQVKTKCIQPQLGSPLNVMDGKARVTCAVRKECADSPLTIFDTKEELCRNYSPETCERSDINDNTVGFSTNVSRTAGERYSFVLCQTVMGENVEYIIDWEGDESDGCS